MFTVSVILSVGLVLAVVCVIVAVRARRLVLAAGIVLAVVVVGWLVGTVWSTFAHGYTAFRAAAHATDALGRFVEQRRKWPASWKDLESLPVGDAPGSLPPSEWAEVRAHVKINFDISLDEVAHQRVDDFDAIKPDAPVPSTYSHNIVSLLETVRKVNESETNGKERKRDRPLTSH